MDAVMLVGLLRLFIGMNLIGKGKVRWFWGGMLMRSPWGRRMLGALKAVRMRMRVVRLRMLLRDVWRWMKGSF